MIDKEDLKSEILVGVTFATFMGAVSLFFTGLLTSQYKSFDSTIRVPVQFLIISTFSYIFSAAIYSNAGAEITRGNFSKDIGRPIVRRYLTYANNIFEFCGLYPFILATPLVIGAVSQDHFLRITTIIVVVISLAVYSLSNFSVLHTELKSTAEKCLLTTVIIGLAVLLYYAQYAVQRYSFLNYNFLGILLLLCLACLAAVFARSKKQYPAAKTDTSAKT